MTAYTLADPPRPMPGPGDRLPTDHADAKPCQVCGEPSDPDLKFCEDHDDLADADRATLLDRIGQLEGALSYERRELFAARKCRCGGTMLLGTLPCECAEIGGRS